MDDDGLMVREESRLGLRGRIGKCLAGLAVVVATQLMAPAPAIAHDELTATSPADGATVTTPVTEVTLTFSGPVRADGSTVTVTGPDGLNHGQGTVSVLNTVVHQPVTPLVSGAYRVEWRVIAGDGDPMTGQYTFTLALPPGLEPTTASPTTSRATGSPVPEVTATDQSGGGGSVTPVWWLLAALLGIGLVVAIVVGRRRLR